MSTPGPTKDNTDSPATGKTLEVPAETEEIFSLSPQQGSNSKRKEESAARDKIIAVSKSGGKIEEDQQGSGPEHELHARWAFSFQREWMSPIYEILAFQTAEKFWGLWNNIATPSKMGSKGTVCLFRYGINPTWEDEQNKKGGQWTVAVGDAMDDCWLFLLLAIIGETFTDAECICGATLKIRSKDKAKLALWINTRNEDQVDRIGRELRKFTENPRTLYFWNTSELGKPPAVRKFQQKIAKEQLEI